MGRSSQRLTPPRTRSRAWKSRVCPPSSSGRREPTRKLITTVDVTWSRSRSLSSLENRPRIWVVKTKSSLKTTKMRRKKRTRKTNCNRNKPQQIRLYASENFKNLIFFCDAFLFIFFYLKRIRRQITKLLSVNYIINVVLFDISYIVLKSNKFNSLRLKIIMYML